MSRAPRHLVADVLDEQVVDAQNLNAGRVDGIVLALRNGQPPRVVAIEVSPITLLARINRRLAAWWSRVDRQVRADRGAPFRIPWEALDCRERKVQFHTSVESTPINALEDRLRAAIVDRIPGA